MQSFEIDGKEVVRVRQTNGYVDATMMCKAAGKEWSTYWKVPMRKAFIARLSEKLKIETTLLVKSRRTGPYAERGTWVHPLVAMDLATWCSTTFKLHVYEWVREWVNADLVNETMAACVVADKGESDNDQPEKAVRDRLAESLRQAGDPDVRVEVKCVTGYADIVTSDTVIEVKEMRNWMHALGQVIAYTCSTFPNKRKRIHLFRADCDNSTTSFRDIKRVCTENCVDVTRE